MSDDRLETQLQDCTVRLSTGNNRGTGFFVAPDRILTCAHVVKSADAAVEVYWQSRSQSCTARVEAFCAERDVALLQLTESLEERSCVRLAVEDPELGDRCYSYGYPKEYPDGDSATLEYEGTAYKESATLYKLNLK